MDETPLKILKSIVALGEYYESAGMKADIFEDKLNALVEKAKKEIADRESELLKISTHSIQGGLFK